MRFQTFSKHVSGLNVDVVSKLVSSVCLESWDSSVGLDGREVGVRVPVRGNFSLLHVVQTGSGVHPASHPVDTRDSFCGSKAAGA
jgi:hypothetical protein